MISKERLAEIRAAVEKASPTTFHATAVVAELLSELDRLRSEAAELWDWKHDKTCSTPHHPEPQPECVNPYRGAP